jgi:hypothetical protein
MLYIGHFTYSRERHNHGTFQLVVAAKGTEDVEQVFQDYLASAKTRELLEDAERVYLDSIVEIDSIPETPAFINLQLFDGPVPSFGGSDFPDGPDGVHVFGWAGETQVSEEDREPFATF